MNLKPKYDGTVSQGHSGDVYNLGEGIFAKRYRGSGTHNALEHCAREHHYLQQLQGTTLVTPRPLFVNTSGQEPVMGMSQADGEFRTDFFDLVANPENHTHLADEAAHLMASIHAVEPKFYDAGYGVECPLSIVLREALEIDGFYEHRENFYKALSELIQFEKRNGDVVFCHGDVHDRNVYFQKGSLAIKGLVDFAYSGYGFPEVDFRHLRIIGGFFDQAVEKYQELTGREISEKRSNMVEIVHAVRRLAICEFEIRQSSQPPPDLIKDRGLFAQRICNYADRLGISDDSAPFSSLISAQAEGLECKAVLT